MLGAKEKIGNLRVSSTAIEFDLFASQTDLDKSRNILESKLSKVITLRPIEARVPTGSKDETLREGISLFNQERYWEAHETLEEIWHPATGRERDVIQGLILTAAAFVHYQKNEIDVCLSILGRALPKLDTIDSLEGLDIGKVRGTIRRIVDEKNPELFQIHMS